MKNIDERLRESLVPDLVPEDDLNASILKQAKEIEKMKNKKIRPAVAAAVAAGVLAVGSVSTYAAYRYLTPSQVADTLTESGFLVSAFAGSDATLVNETQRTGGYNVTFLGTVTGKTLIPALEDDAEAEGLSVSRTYAVVAIERADGSPMPTVTDSNYKTFCVSALIHGNEFTEINNGLINAGVSSFVQDGVQYELYECDDLEIFAGMGVSLGVVESFGQETSAFTYDPVTGIYGVNSDYDKMNALFDLPLDISKADDEAADSYLKERIEENDMEDTDYSSGNTDVDAWIGIFSDAADSTNASWTDALANAREDTAYTQACEVDENGYVCFSTRDGENENRYWVEVWPYEEGVEVFNTAESDGTIEGTAVSTLTKNEDGTFTMKYYVPAIES